MIELTDTRFLNPVWHALHGPHRHLAIGSGAACRYPADVAPFAAMEAGSDTAHRHLHALLGVGESVLGGGRAASSGSARGAGARVRANGVSTGRPAAGAGAGPTSYPFAGENAGEMVALTDVAFPGFFRPATHRMGRYVGIRMDGTARSPWPASGCGSRVARAQRHLHPSRASRQGLAAGLIGHLVETHRRAGLTSWLHVGAPNTRAIQLYERLGFLRMRNLDAAPDFAHRVRRGPQRLATRDVFGCLRRKMRHNPSP